MLGENGVEMGVWCRGRPRWTSQPTALLCQAPLGRWEVGRLRTEYSSRGPAPACDSHNRGRRRSDQAQSLPCLFLPQDRSGSGRLCLGPWVGTCWDGPSAGPAFQSFALLPALTRPILTAPLLLLPLARPLALPLPATQLPMPPPSRKRGLSPPTQLSFAVGSALLGSTAMPLPAPPSPLVPWPYSLCFPFCLAALPAPPLPHS